MVSRFRNAEQTGDADRQADASGKCRVPAWRRIEVWRERQALKKALKDIGAEDSAYDETIFLQDPTERGQYFVRDDGDDPEPEFSEDENWDDELS